MVYVNPICMKTFSRSASIFSASFSNPLGQSMESALYSCSPTGASVQNVLYAFLLIALILFPLFAISRLTFLDIETNLPG